LCGTQIVIHFMKRMFLNLHAQYIFRI
jgi:hypothetical protein